MPEEAGIGATPQSFANAGSERTRSGTISISAAMSAPVPKAVNKLTFVTNDVETGALSILYAATQDVPGNACVGPDWFAGLKGYPAVRKPGKAGLDSDVADRLWKATAPLV